jgi:hypothetical protein
MPSRHDHRDGDFFGLNRFDQFHTRDLGHAQIGDHQTVTLLPKQSESPGSVLGDIDIQTQAHLQQFFQRFPSVFQVLHNQYALAWSVWHG